MSRIPVSRSSSLMKHFVGVSVPFSVILNLPFHRKASISPQSAALQPAVEVLCEGADSGTTPHHKHRRHVSEEKRASCEQNPIGGVANAIGCQIFTCRKLGIHQQETCGPKEDEAHYREGLTEVEVCTRSTLDRPIAQTRNLPDSPSRYWVSVSSEKAWRDD